MYTVLIGYDGDKRVTTHKTFTGANKEFVRVCKNLAFPNDFPAWRGVVLCRSYSVTDSVVTPKEIVVEAHRND